MNGWMIMVDDNGCRWMVDNGCNHVLCFVLILFWIMILILMDG